MTALTTTLDTNKLSDYQVNIVDAVCTAYKNESGENFVLQALAGCGKSTMLTMLVQFLVDELDMEYDEVICLVFTKKNKQDLADKWNKVAKGLGDSVTTLHSLGYRIYRESMKCSPKDVNLNNYKYRNISEELGFISDYDGNAGSLDTPPVDDDDYPIPVIKAEDFTRLIDLLREFCLDPNKVNIEWLIGFYDLSLQFPSQLVEPVKKVLHRGYNIAITKTKPKKCKYKQYQLDFTDMSYIPLQLFNAGNTVANRAFSHIANQYKVIMIDEAQDTNEIQLQILQAIKSKNPSSSIVAVGDRNQAVYLFRGCLSDGMNQFVERFNSTELELPINYRCPANHLEYVKDNCDVPIQNYRTKTGGLYAYPTSKFSDSLFDDDGFYKFHGLSVMGISRKNSPLVRYALTCIARKVPAIIKDRDLGNRLQSIVRDIVGSSKNYNVETFLDNLEKYLNENLLKAKSQTKRATLTDTLDAIKVLFESYRPENLNQWKNLIDDIFKDDDKDAIRFYTIHSAKGAEADIVLFVNADDCPLIFNSSNSESVQQEYNLIYVALTRSKQDLYCFIEKEVPEFLYSMLDLMEKKQ